MSTWTQDWIEYGVRCRTFEDQGNWAAIEQLLNDANRNQRVYSSLNSDNPWQYDSIGKKLRPLKECEGFRQSESGEKEKIYFTPQAGWVTREEAAELHLSIFKIFVTTPAGFEKNRTAYEEQKSLLEDVCNEVEIYCLDSSLGKQMQYADRRGFTLAIIAGENELASNTVNIRNLKTGDQCTVSRNELVETVRTML